MVLEQFADNGDGFYAYIDTMREAERLFVHGLTGTLQTVALDAKVQVTFNADAVAKFRLLGYENRQLEHDDFRDDTVDGGEVGVGHNATALYEITLREGADLSPDTALATVELRWHDPADREPVERSATVTVGDLSTSFEEAPVRLRQAVLVAAFAECLRGGPWAEQVTLDWPVRQASSLRLSLPEDARVEEFVGLVRLAAKLADQAR